MKFKTITALAAALILLFSCRNNFSGKEKKEHNTIANIEVAEFEKPEDFQQADTAFLPEPGQQLLPNNSNTASKNIDWDKKIIKTANLHIEVKDFAVFGNLLKKIVIKYGGYISQEQQEQNEYRIQNIVTIKVPVDQFESVMNELSATDEKITERKISSEDVTTEVVDTKSRIEAKKQVRQRYLELLKQARTMEDILSVQSEINDVQQEIEMAAGRMEYLQHSSAMSTINLTYLQVLDPAARDANKANFFTKIRESFKGGWNFLGDVFIGIVSVWPLILLGLIIWMMLKRYKNSIAAKIK